MCTLCVEEILAKLNIQEVRTAGMELLSTSKSEEEKRHIQQRLEEIEEERNNSSQS